MNAQNDWDDVRYFLAVARQGSLSGAARILGVNHSTVLRRINALEATMAVRLFDKLPRGYVLTPAGDELHQAALGVEERLVEVGLSLSGRDTSITGTLRVTTVDVIAMHVLPRHIAAFHARHPGIRVDVTVAEASLSLTRREADVAIRVTNRPPENLVGRVVADLACAPYAAAADDRAVPLRARDWVGLDESFDHTAMARWLKQTVPPDRVRYRVNSVAALIEAVRAGVGCGALPCVADTLPGLRRLGPVLPEVSARVWLLTHPDLRRMGRVRAFLDDMAQALAGERDRLEGRLAIGQPVGQG